MQVKNTKNPAHNANPTLGLPILQKDFIEREKFLMCMICKEILDLKKITKPFNGSFGQAITVSANCNSRCKS